MNGYMDITCYMGSFDFRMFKDIVNQGIDSHLEGFTRSKFFRIKNSDNFMFSFDWDELPILLRRLEEIGTPIAMSWWHDINGDLDED